MTQYNRHKKAVRIFRDITSNPEKYLIIHYSCESFIDKEDGRTPRITTIAIRYFESSQTRWLAVFAYINPRTPVSRRSPSRAVRPDRRRTGCHRPEKPQA